MLDPDRYLGFNLDSLQGRYVEVCCQLGALYADLHTAEVERQKAWYHEFGMAESNSVAAGERYANAVTQHLWVAVQDVKRGIAECECERDMLLNLIGWRV